MIVEINVRLRKITLLFGIILFGFVLSSDICAQHFQTVWTGNPYKAMNIVIQKATIGFTTSVNIQTGQEEIVGVNMVPGDEIGIFDVDTNGVEYCVGSGILTGVISDINPLVIILSENTGGSQPDGYNQGNQIIIKQWDNDCYQEVPLSITDWNPLLDTVFESWATGVVFELTGYPPTQIQEIELSQGWNLFSANVNPCLKNMLTVLDTIIDSSQLIKVIDESGGIVQNISGFGWINTIGNIENTEGYYLKVTENTNFSIVGGYITLPFDIPLQTGWNIMGYPLISEQDALQALQPLVNNGTLYKIMDEQGGFIQNIESLGWLNTIGDFEPGEGYYLKVNSSTNLTLDESGSKSNLQLNDNIALAYFSPIQGEAIYNPMNFVIKLENETSSIVTIGDEIAIFDGEFCVGATVISENNQEYISIVTSMNENEIEGKYGYKVGNEFCFRFWNNETNELYANVTPDNQNNTNVFQPLETYVGNLSTNALGIKESDDNKNGILNIIVAPNPVSSKLNVYYNSQNSGNSVIRIFNSSGKSIIASSYENQKSGWNSAIINVNYLRSGIYIGEIVFTTNEETIIQRFKFVKM